MQIGVRRIGYEPASVPVTTQGAVTLRDIYLRPIAIGLAPVVVSARDEFAREVRKSPNRILLSPKADNVEEENQ